MPTVIIRRSVQAILTLVLGSVVIWLVISAVPGDPAVMKLGIDATPEQLAFERERLGLDEPLPVQFAIWAGDLFRGDLGVSLLTNAPVTEMLGPRILATFQLAFAAMVAIVLMAIPLGVAQAVFPRSLLARVITAYNGLAVSIPVFWSGVILVLLFSLHLGWLPSTSTFIPFWEEPAEALRALALPTITIGILGSGVLSRFVAAALTDALAHEYVRTAASKGLSKAQVVMRHAMRNAAIPVVTIMGLQVGSLVGGALIVEAVFNYPGLGRLLIMAVERQDRAVIQAGLLFTVLFFVLVNLVVDLLYGVLDPRVREQR